MDIYRMRSSKYEQQTENTLEGAIVTAQGLADCYHEPIELCIGTPIPGTYDCTWQYVRTINPNNNQ